VPPRAGRPSLQQNGSTVRILLWNVHGGYSDSLLSGGHAYLYLTREAGGSGLPSPSIDGPVDLTEVGPEELRDAPPDVVVVQNLEELAVCAALGLGPDRVPTVFLEHNTPREDVPESRHPLADRDDVTIVHVTHFNALFWDCGRTRTAVVEHGVPDPGYRYTGELAHLAFVVNEPVRRWRVTGTDLLSRFAEHPVDAFGIDADLLPPALPQCRQLSYAGNLKPGELWAALPQRRVYLHLNRWTSLGLSLIQAMMLGMPVVVLNTTEASHTVPVDAGALSTDPEVLRREAARLLVDPEEAVRRGRVAREAALERHGMARFLAEWDRVLEGVAG
jgi:glycosyltransferase involved in cell wall biosynthesis